MIISAENGRGFLVFIFRCKNRRPNKESTKRLQSTSAACHLLPRFGVASDGTSPISDHMPKITDANEAGRSSSRHLLVFALHRFGTCAFIHLIRVKQQRSNLSLDTHTRACHHALHPPRHTRAHTHSPHGCLVITIWMVVFQSESDNVRC